MLMTAQQIKALPPEEKLRLMENLWEDMRSRYDNDPLSPEMAALLQHRKERVELGHAKLLDWNEVKFAIGHG
jgi:putative addiction module component (TIGR02574 family)